MRPVSSSAPICCSTCSSGGTGVNPLQTVELKTYDWRLTRTARPETARKDIALVEIDEYSLRNLEPYAGRWPWPRVVHAMLLDYLARGPGEGRSLYDVNFAEAGRPARGFEFGGATLSGAESDRALVEVRQGGRQRDPASPTRPTRRLKASSRQFPDPGFALNAPGIIERRVVFPPVRRAGRQRRRPRDTTCSCSIPTARSGTRCRSCAPAIAACRRSACRRRCGRPESGRRTSDSNGTVLTMGDRAMPLSLRRVRTQTGTDAFSVGTDQLPRSGAARRPEEPHVPNLFRSSTC